MRSELDLLSQRVSELEAKNTVLNTKIAKLEHDQDNWEWKSAKWFFK